MNLRANVDDGKVTKDGDAQISPKATCTRARSRTSSPAPIPIRSKGAKETALFNIDAHHRRIDQAGATE